MAQTAGVVNGSEILIYDSKTLIAGATSHTLSQAVATFDTSSKDSAGSRYIKPGQKSWSASGDHLFAFDATYGYSQLLGMHQNRTRIYVKLATTNSLNKYYQGYGYITQLDATFPNEGESTFTFTIEGDGPLTEGTGT